MDRQTRMYDNFDKVEQKTIKEIQCFQPTKGKKQGNNCPNCAKKA